MQNIDIDRATIFSFEKASSFVNFLNARDWKIDQKSEVMTLSSFILKIFISDNDISQDMKESALNMTFDFIKSSYERVDYVTNGKEKENVANIAKSLYKTDKILSLYQERIGILKELSNSSVSLDNEQLDSEKIYKKEYSQIIDHSKTNTLGAFEDVGFADEDEDEDEDLDDDERFEYFDTSRSNLKM